MRPLLLSFLTLLLGCGSSETKPPISHTLKLYEGGACPGVSAFAMFSESFQGEVCDKFLQVAAIPTCFSTAVLWGSFGENTSCFNRLVDQAKELNQTLVLVIHYNREVGRERQALLSTDLFHWLTVKEWNSALREMMAPTKQAIIDRLTEIKDFLIPHEGYVFPILSDGLEPFYDMPARIKLNEVILENWPHEIAWDVDKLSPAPFGVFNEKHSYSTDPFGTKCIRNGDGQDASLLAGSGVTLRGKRPASLSDVMAWFRRSLNGGCVTLLWQSCLQGLCDGQNTTTLERRVSFPEPYQKVMIEIMEEVKDIGRLH